MAEKVASASEGITFEMFFESHYEQLLRVLFLVTGNRHEAEDLAQEAFVKLYERWDRVRGVANPAGYLYRTALNTNRSRLRRVVEELLSMPYIQIGDSAIFVWPSFFTSDPNHFTEAELRLARRIATEEEIQSWKEYGSYLGYRVGIEPDGDWLFFVAGD